MLYSFTAWKENNKTTSICRWHESRILHHKTLLELIGYSVKSQVQDQHTKINSILSIVQPQTCGNQNSNTIHQPPKISQETKPPQLR